MLPSFITAPTPEVYNSTNYVVLDFETDNSHGDHGAAVHEDNRLLLGCYRTGPGHPSSCQAIWDMPEWTQPVWADEFGMEQLLIAIKQADFVVAHNAKYELGWLKRCGLDLTRVLVFDTMIAEYVLLGNLKAGDETMLPRSVSLDMCCRRRGLKQKDPVVDLLIKHGINPRDIPRPWLEGRCKQDVETTELLFISQRDLLSRTGRLGVLLTRCLLTPVLAEIEFEGMALDEAAVKAAYDESVARLAELERQMAAMTGGMNWRSPKQAAEFLYDKLKFRELTKPNGEPKRSKPTKLHPNGQRKADQKTLDKLSADTPEQEAFLALRKEIGKVNALLSKNLEFFQGVCTEFGGVFHAEFNQTVTATHRLSSSGIQLKFRDILGRDGKPKTSKVQFQNMPRALKRLFRAKREGWLMGEADGSQLEFRVAMDLGNDAKGIADISDRNFDVHILSGSTMAGRDYEEALRAFRDGDKKAADMRQAGKSESFKPLYGGSRGTKKQERWYSYFRERYPDLARTQADWVNEVLRTKRLVTPWGMRYYWPNARMDRSGYCNVTTAVYNYPVQAFATAEIIPIAIVYLWHRIREEGLEDRIRLVNTVHDSVVAEIAPGHEDDFRRLAIQAFTRDVYAYLERVYGYEFKVPLGAGVKIGPRWGAGDEATFNVYRDGREERIK